MCKDVSFVPAENCSNPFGDLDKRCETVHRLKCFDGTVVPFGDVVGCCVYAEHPGFITKELCQAHQCLDKNCVFYRAKPQKVRVPKTADDSPGIVAVAKEVTKKNDMIRVRDAEYRNGAWVIKYVYLTSDVDLSKETKKLSEKLGCPVVFESLDYSFENRMKIFLD